MLAAHAKISEDEAIDRLLQHLNADDLNALNNDQRIILTSHRFAQQVTSAALWLNEKSSSADLITCIQLVPYHDSQTKTLCVQASTIIPLPTSEDYMVSVGDNLHKAQSLIAKSFGEKLSRTFQQSKNHDSTPFFKRVGDLSVNGLPYGIRPDRRSKWSGSGGGGMRYYHFWYSSPMWSNWGTSFRVNLYPQGESGEWQANVEFRHNQSGLHEWLDQNAVYGRLPEGCEKLFDEDGFTVKVGMDTLNNEFGDKIAETVRRFIVEVTPVVNNFEGEGNEEAI